VPEASVTAPDLRGRSFLKELDHTPDELRGLLDLAATLKAERRAGTEKPRLAARRIGLLFEKASTRTRLAFEIASADQGAHVTYLDPSGSHLGYKESVADTGSVMGRFFDALAYRGRHQADIEVLAQHARIPVYNALTDEWHPTQMLADFLTMREVTGKTEAELHYAFVGDLRFNMGRSLLVMGALMGSDVRMIGPGSLSSPPEVLEAARTIAARTGARITVTEDVAAGVEGVDVIHTDVWMSMGEPIDAWRERVALLRPYQVDAAMLERSGNPGVRFMHCLPAYHDLGTEVGRDMMVATGMLDGLEVTDDVFRSEASVVFDQAENRMHTIKALLVATLAE
jgi:ornithine carbamoyltransferase